VTIVWKSAGSAGEGVKEVCDILQV